MSKFVPLVSLDFETNDSRGASFETYRKDFYVSSLSLAWRDVSGNIKQQYSDKPETINQMLTSLHFSQAPIIAHNIAYEMQVVKSCYPRLNLNFYGDTMRLAQMLDAGGNEFEAPDLTFEQQMSIELGELTEKDIKKDHNKKFGLSLEACARRFLPIEHHNHKKKAHDWLTEHAQIKKNHGQYLHLLPPAVLQEYNDADTRITLILFEELIRWAKEHNVDWGRDHQLYLMRARLINSAYLDGIRIDRGPLLTYILETEAEIEKMDGRFLARFAEEIRELKRRRFNKVRDEFCADPALKSDRARQRRKDKLAAGELDDMWAVFNIGSSSQLAELFCGILGMVPKFLTPKGSPSFKSAHLTQWGEGGEMLLKRRKRLIVLAQSIGVYLASSYDNRVHCSVRSAGTRTNRVSGGR